MSIQDFLKEAQKRAGGEKLSPAQQEIHEFATMIYYKIRDGKTQAWAEEVSRMLVKSIAPDLSMADTLKAAMTIEGIVLTVFTELFGEGTLIKREERKDETGGKG